MYGHFVHVMTFKDTASEKNRWTDCRDWGIEPDGLAFRRGWTRKRLFCPCHDTFGCRADLPS